MKKFALAAVATLTVLTSAGPSFAAVGISTCGGPTALRARFSTAISTDANVVKTQKTYTSAKLVLSATLRDQTVAKAQLDGAAKSLASATTLLHTAAVNYVKALLSSSPTDDAPTTLALNRAATVYTAAETAHAKATTVHTRAVAAYRLAKTKTAVAGQNAPAATKVATTKAHSLLTPCADGGPYAPVLLTSPKVSGAKLYLGGGKHSVGGAGSHDMDPYTWGVADMTAPAGTPVYAHKGGTVTFSAASSSYAPGYVKIVSQGGSVQLYAHLDHFFVKAGQKVSAGTKLAQVSAAQSWPHVHFEWANTTSLVDHGCNSTPPWLAGRDDPGLSACKN